MGTMQIGVADLQQKVALIAEIGNNHEGSLECAREMIEAAWEAGADAVKLQTLVPELFVSPVDIDRLEQLRRFALPLDESLNLIVEYRQRGIFVFSTPLDLASLDGLSKVAHLIKISSGDLTYKQLIQAAARTGLGIMLSTGMSYIEEVDVAVGWVEEVWKEQENRPQLGLLHCASVYPTEPREVNLAAIRTLQDRYEGVPVGYSDHTVGVEVAILAVAAGARFIEKHFTLDKTRSGFRDHALSADPADLQRMRSQVDEVFEQMGTGVKAPSDAEGPSRLLFRRSLTLVNCVEMGHVLNADDLICQRPGTGLEPWRLDEVLGRRARRPLAPGHILTADDLI